MEEIMFIQVFVPYSPYHHFAYYAYDVSEYGKLEFGSVVVTSMGIGIIVQDDVPEDKLHNMNIVDIYRIANSKEEKTIRKDWWDDILKIHSILNEKNL